jgi:hypothetical protein
MFIIRRARATKVWMKKKKFNPPAENGGKRRRQ